MNSDANRFDFEAWRRNSLSQVESALEGLIDAHSPADLGVVMRYGILGGGKRLRALLVLAAAEVSQDPVQKKPAQQQTLSPALRAACAVEMIHAYSLIHDDMPCMDNDVLRRGKPTVHVAFGEAQALLAGDALQALAFEILTPDEPQMLDALQAQLCRLLARASGAEGMAGGQAIDLASVGQQLTEPQLRRMHELKTGALLQASVLMGYACSPKLASIEPLQSYGAAIGLAFQVVDDILDVTAHPAELGKTVGKDAEQGKPTYVSLMGLAAANAYSQTLLNQALTALGSIQQPGTEALRHLAKELVDRQS